MPEDDHKLASEKWKTIDEFCKNEACSKSHYYKMRRLGLGPTEITLPGGRIRVPQSGHLEMRLKLLRWQATEAAALERERAKAIAKRAREGRGKKGK
jgi:hypothetical protein